MSLVRSASAINWKKETLFNPSDNIPLLQVVQYAETDFDDSLENEWSKTV